MTTTAETRTLTDRLQPRVAREKRFAQTGRKLRNKSLLFKYEKFWMRPVIKTGLQLLGLYERGMNNALKPVTRELHFSFPNLPKAFDGYKLLHISDLHIDGVPELAPILSGLLATIDVDLCVITGDYRFDDEGSCGEVYPLMRPIIDSISTSDGLFGILGNHDMSEIALRLDDMGLRMLVNEAVEIRRGKHSIWLAGIDDPFDFRCDDLPGTLRPVPLKDFKILLAHTPELFHEAADLGVDLYLCGHTHAGQLRLPLIGSIRNNASCPKEYARGDWQHEAMRGFTTAGVGCSGLPVRYNCPPEIAVIHLHCN